MTRCYRKVPAVLHHRFTVLLWLLDILLLLERYPGLDWDEIARLVSRMRLERPVHFYLEALNTLGLWRSPPRLRRALAPSALRYRIASRSCLPGTIFRPQSGLQALIRRGFREAFKLTER